MDHTGSLCWGMLQHPRPHGARFGDGDRLPLVSRVVPTILLAWNLVEGEIGILLGILLAWDPVGWEIWILLGILLAWDPVEGETMGEEITSVAAVCTQG